MIINEIHSDPTDSKSRFTEFVELFNPLSTDVNVGGWLLTGGVNYTIPSNTIIPACSYLVMGRIRRTSRRFSATAARWVRGRAACGMTATKLCCAART